MQETPRCPSVLKRWAAREIGHCEAIRIKKESWKRCRRRDGRWAGDFERGSWGREWPGTCPPRSLYQASRDLGRASGRIAVPGGQSSLHRFLLKSAPKAVLADSGPCLCGPGDQASYEDLGRWRWRRGQLQVRLELRSSPAAQPLPGVPVPDRPRPRGRDPRSRQRDVALRDGSGIYGAKGGAEMGRRGDICGRTRSSGRRDDWGGGRELRNRCRKATAPRPGWSRSELRHSKVIVI